MFASGNRRSYDDFKKQVPQIMLQIVDSVREYCLGLGENVVEDVRMHRIVFGKSMTFRWFADVEPTRDNVIVKVQKNRKEPAQVYQISNEKEASDLMRLIKEAYETIH